MAGGPVFSRLSDLIKQGESQVLEFKRSLSLRDAGLESLCGMVNVDHGSGVVVFGVAPDGSVVGVEPGNLDKAQRSIVQAIASNVEPPLNPTILVESVSGTSVLAITAQRSKAVPYHEFGGRAFIRVGTVTRQLLLAEKLALARSRNRDGHTGPWQCSSCRTFASMYSPGLRDDGHGGITRSYACPCGGEMWPAI